MCFIVDCLLTWRILFCRSFVHLCVEERPDWFCICFLQGDPKFYSSSADVYLNVLVCEFSSWWLLRWVSNPLISQDAWALCSVKTKDKPPYPFLNQWVVFPPRFFFTKKRVFLWFWKYMQGSGPITSSPIINPCKGNKIQVFSLGVLYLVLDP